MAFNNNNNPNGIGEDQNENRNELWQRQKSVLESLTEAEKIVYRGMELQSPLYDAEFGIRRNLVSVSTMLIGAERMLFILAPQLKDKTGEGINSETYGLYKQGLEQTQALINKAIIMGINKPLGEAKLNQAYAQITELLSLLRQETADLGFDFRKKPAREDEWAE
jgi:hypothetical protein